MIWTASELQFKEFMQKINGLHKTIKLSYSYELKDRSTTFLDNKVRIVNKILQIYKENPLTVQYLLPSSNHPGYIFKNISFSLALRLDRNVSKRDTLKQKLTKLKSMLLSRKYNKNM
jgi:hypothetical protein